MAQPSIEKRQRELQESLPHLQGDLDLLKRMIQRWVAANPDKKKWAAAFRMYYGLDEEIALTCEQISDRFGHTSSWTSNVVKSVLRRLRHRAWLNIDTWPEPIAVPTVLSGMRQRRVDEIAVRLHMHRYQSLGTERYMSELKAAAQDLGISDDEIRQFYLAIDDRLMRRK